MMDALNRRGWWLLVVLGMVAVALRVAGPSDIDDHAQPGPIDHIVDITVNGHGLIQRDADGELASKPPMYPWVGAIGVYVTGQTAEWTFKLPSLLAWAGIAWLVHDLGRRTIGATGGLLAAAFWLVNPHSYKLMYTARPDMLLTFWIVLCVWCVHGLHPAWRDASQRQGRLIALFWFGVAAAALTKGPPALLPVVWLVAVIAWDGAWRDCRWPAHAAGLLLAMAAPLAWLGATLAAHPDYLDILRFETYDRITGTGTGELRGTSRFAAAGYFVARFAPWSVLAIGAAVLLWRRARAAAGGGAVRWVAAWIAVVLGFFMLSRGLRADYLLPAHPVAALGAAALVLHAERQRGHGRNLVHLLLGGLVLTAIAAAVAAPLRAHVPQPLTFTADGFTVTVGWLYPWMLAAVVAVMGLAGLAGVRLTHQRRYVPAAWAGAFCLAGVMGLHDLSMSDAAIYRAGDRAHGIVELAERISAARQQPVAVYYPGRIPLQAMRGELEPDPHRVLQLLDGGAIMLTSGSTWRALREDYGERADPLMVMPNGRDYRGRKDADTWLLLRIDATDSADAARRGDQWHRAQPAS